MHNKYSSSWYYVIISTIVKLGIKVKSNKRHLRLIWVGLIILLFIKIDLFVLMILICYNFFDRLIWIRLEVNWSGKWKCFIKNWCLTVLNKFLRQKKPKKLSTAIFRRFLVFLNCKCGDVFKIVSNSFLEKKVSGVLYENLGKYVNGWPNLTVMSWLWNTIFQKIEVVWGINAILFP